jgi:hypothetical protein
MKRFFLVFLFLCFPILSWAETVTVKVEPGTSSSSYRYEVLKITRANITSYNACHMNTQSPPPTPYDHTESVGKTEYVGPDATGIIEKLELNLNDDICVFAWRTYESGGNRGPSVTRTSSVASAIVKVQDVLNREDNTIVISNRTSGQLSYISFARPPSTPPSYTVDLSFSTGAKKRITIYQPFRNAPTCNAQGGILADQEASGVTTNVALFLGQNYEQPNDVARYFCFQVDGASHGPYTVGPNTAPGKLGTIKITTPKDSCFEFTNTGVCNPKN